MTLQELKDFVARSCYGRTTREVLAIGKCIECGEEALSKCYSEDGRREYKISGLCEECFDAITAGGEDTEYDQQYRDYLDQEDAF